MIELSLVGYTEDAEHLVLDLGADGEGRYLLRVDESLLATLQVIGAERDADGRPLPLEIRAPTPAGSADEPAPALADSDPTPPAGLPPVPLDAADATGAAAPPDQPADGEAVTAGPPDEAAAVEPPQPADPVVDPVVDGAAEAGGQTSPAPRTERTVPSSRLSPGEIQARLRQGRSVRAVAREAGTDRAWVERWLQPIRAERERVLADARSRRVNGGGPLGATVDARLERRGADPQQAQWTVVRREDGRWRVSVRFDDRGRRRTASWVLDEERGRLRPQSPLATDLSTPPRAGRR